MIVMLVFALALSACGGAPSAPAKTIFVADENAAKLCELAKGMNPQANLTAQEWADRCAIEFSKSAADISLEDYQTRLSQNRLTTVVLATEVTALGQSGAIPAWLVAVATAAITATGVNAYVAFQSDSSMTFTLPSVQLPMEVRVLAITTETLAAKAAQQLSLTEAELAEVASITSMQAISLQEERDSGYTWGKTVSYDSAILNCPKGTDKLRVFDLMHPETNNHFWASFCPKNDQELVRALEEVIEQLKARKDLHGLEILLKAIILCLK